MNYRVILQAEGRSTDGEWFGLYAAREVSAAEEAEAVGTAKAEIEAAWATRGSLGAVDAIAVWRPSIFNFKRCPAGGHSYYDDDADAQLAALRLEAEASGLPKRLLSGLIAGLR